MPTLATACCVLHNLCEVHGDSLNNDWLIEEDAESTTSTANADAESTTCTTTAVPAHAAPSAVTIKNAFCDYFE